MKFFYSQSKTFALNTNSFTRVRKYFACDFANSENYTLEVFFLSNMISGL
jgi:hypothetical protein